MRDIVHDPQIPAGWVEHWHDEVTADLMRMMVRFMTEDERAELGIKVEEDIDPGDFEPYHHCVGPLSESLLRLVGAKEDSRSESVTLDHIGGYVLAFGRYYGAEVAVLLQWRTEWVVYDNYVSVIAPGRDLFVYVHPDHDPQLRASVRGD